MIPEALEQVFVTRREGRIELLTVRVDAVERRSRVTLPTPTSDPAEAMRWLARQLAREGRVRNLERLRVRMKREGDWQEAPELRAELRRVFAHEAGAAVRT